MKTWLDKFVNSMSEVESPQRHFFWSGLSVISACVRKNVYLDKFKYNLYPNIYVILLAKSGSKKGVPMMYASNLAESTGEIRILDGRFTVQAMIKELSMQRTLETGRIFNDARAFIIAPELKSLLAKDDAAIGILTDLQNTHEHEKKWSNMTKGGGTEELKNPCITLLGASNEAYFETIVQGADIEGGFIGRTFIIYESKRNTINSLMYKPKIPYPKTELEGYLKELATNVKGEFTICPSTRKMFDEWYHRLAKNEYNDRTGTLSRLDDQVLKVAMLISLSRDTSLVIDDEIMDFTIQKCEENFSGTRRVSQNEGRSPITKFSAIVIKLLLGELGYKMERKILLIKGYPDITSVELDQVYDVLGTDSGVGVLIRSFGADNKWYYTLDSSHAEVFKKELV